MWFSRKKGPTLESLERRIKTLEASAAERETSIDAVLTEHRDRLDKHESRISDYENFKQWLSREGD